MSGHTFLAEWLSGQFGIGKRFRSGRALARVAQLNGNTVTNIVERGRAEPETLLRIAEVLRVSPQEIFQIAGWLPPGEEDDVGPLLPDEEQLVEVFRSLSEEHRLLLLGLAQALLVPGHPLEQSLRGSNSNPDHPEERG